MKRRFQRSMGMILCITLIVYCALFTIIMYQNNTSLVRESVEKEVILIKDAIEASDISYLDEIESYLGNSRVTLIDADGTVLFDTEEDITVMENHGSREEVLQAYGGVTGYAIRVSDTIGEQTYYCAMLLNNGMVIRVSNTMNSVWTAIINIIPITILIGAVLWVLAMMIARWQTARMIEPINELDVDNPMDYEIYDELKPLLLRIDTSNKAREEVNEMRKEFSANVSHELKTPLTSISGYAELLQNGMVKEEHIERFAGRIYTEANRLIILVEDIIKLSKLDEGKIELEKEDVDLYFMVREISNRLSLQAQKKHIRINISGQSVKYRGIKQVLDEMIYNVCENAIKYNKDGGQLEVWVGATLDGAKVIVKDTGIGIPEDQQERVFERFYRVDKSHSKATGGTGLGLSIVKHGAILHDAKVVLESELNVGTKIEIIF